MCSLFHADSICFFFFFSFALEFPVFCPSSNVQNVQQHLDMESVSTIKIHECNGSFKRQKVFVNNLLIVLFVHSHSHFHIYVRVPSSCIAITDDKRNSETKKNKKKNICAANISALTGHFVSIELCTYIYLYIDGRHEHTKKADNKKKRRRLYANVHKAKCNLQCPNPNWCAVILKLSKAHIERSYSW